jgi:hypothetical protein
MPVTSEKSAPYAPPSAIIDVVMRYRNRGLPTPVTTEVLSRIGITDSLVARTHQALQSVDLIDEDGTPTRFFEALRTAPEADFKAKSAEWLNNAYAEIVKIVDPANDDETRVRDAFRTFNPVGQQPRMVALFLQLYRWAGVRADRAGAPRSERPNTKPKARSVVKSRMSSSSGAGSSDFSLAGQIPPALSGLIASLPPAGKSWSQSKRDAFLKSFAAVLDFVIPVDIPEQQDEENEV